MQLTLDPDVRLKAEAALHPRSLFDRQGNLPGVSYVAPGRVILERRQHQNSDGI